jgi:hypothetical protein
LIRRALRPARRERVAHPDQRRGRGAGPGREHGADLRLHRGHAATVPGQVPPEQIECQVAQVVLEHVGGPGAEAVACRPEVDVDVGPGRGGRGTPVTRLPRGGRGPDHPGRYGGGPDPPPLGQVRAQRGDQR